MEQTTKQVTLTITARPTTFQEAMDKVYWDMRTTMVKKQKDYGPRNILSCGVLGVAVRTNDKIARLLNLYGFRQDGSFAGAAKEVKNESVEDTWLDLANYGLIAQMVMQGIFDLPLQQQEEN